MSRTNDVGRLRNSARGLVSHLSRSFATCLPGSKQCSELNAKKTKDMWSSFKKHSDNPPHLCINDTVIDRETEFKLLGVVIQDNLKWNSHISSILKKANKRIYHVRACKKAHLPDEVGLTT